MITIMYSTITCSLLTTIVILLFVTKFASNKMHGFILYALYGAFLIAAIYTEIQMSTWNASNPTESIDWNNW